MLAPKDLSGVLGMMPSFATEDAVDIRATQTIAVDHLKEGVDRIIKDGIGLNRHHRHLRRMLQPALR